MPLSGQPSERTILVEETAKYMEDANGYIKIICATIDHRPEFLAEFTNAVDSIVRPEMERFLKAFPEQRAWFQIDDEALKNPFQPSIVLWFRIPTIHSVGDQGDTPFIRYRVAKNGNLVVCTYSTRHPDIGGSAESTLYSVAKLTPELVQQDIAKVFLESVENFFHATIKLP